MDSENRAIRGLSLAPEDVTEHLTLKEAAAVVGVPAAELLEQAVTHQVPAFWALLDGGQEPEPLFPVWVARRIADHQVKADDSTRPLVLPMFNLINTYVKERPPYSTHRDAVKSGHALVCRAGSRYGRPHVHVRPEALAAFAQDVGAHVRLHAPSVVTEMLPLLRAKRVTGLRDGDGFQAGRVWWRVPLSVVDPAAGGES